MGKVYKKLVESFGYITEAPVNDTGYDPEKVQYAYQGGKANPDWPGNKPPEETDTNNNKPPVKPKPKPGMAAHPGTRAYQHWLNSHGSKIAVDGKYGQQTMTAGSQLSDKIRAAQQIDKFSSTTPEGKKRSEEFKARSEELSAMMGVGTAHNVKVAPGTGYVYVGSPEYLAAMKKYGYDPKTGDPIPGFQHPNPKLWIGFDSATQPGQSGQRQTGALPSKQEDLILNSVGKLEAIFKKYGIQAECAYKADGSLLTEDDWVLKNINMFSLQEQMEIWKILSEAELTPYGSVGSDIAARRKGAEVASAYKDSLAAGQRYQQGATAAAQNMPDQQSKLAKFGRNLGTRFGMGGGKRAAAKGIAKMGLRAIPFLGTAVLLYDIGSALYDTFATTEIADLDPADQQIIAQEIKNLTQMSQSADYNSVSDETKKRVTAILNAANKMAQKAEA